MPLAEKQTWPPPGAARAAGRGEEHGLHDPPGDTSSVSTWRRQPERAEQRVVEAAASLEVRRRRRWRGESRPEAYPARLTPRSPAEGAQRDDEAEQPPCGDHGEVAQLEPALRGGRIQGGEERLEEVADREHVGDVQDAVWDLALRDEDAGEEVEREDARLVIAGAALARRDDRRQRDARARRTTRRRSRASRAAPASRVPRDRARRRATARSPSPATNISRR